MGDRVVTGSASMISDNPTMHDSPGSTSGFPTTISHSFRTSNITTAILMDFVNLSTCVSVRSSV